MINKLMSLFKKGKEKPPVFHEVIQESLPYGVIRTTYILSGGLKKQGWFILADEPNSKVLYVPYSDDYILLSGRYSRFGSGFAVELKEKLEWIPDEWVGLRIRFVWT